MSKNNLVKNHQSNKKVNFDHQFMWFNSFYELRLSSKIHLAG